jgi:hypothetical protein
MLVTAVGSTVAAFAAGWAAFQATKLVGKTQEQVAVGQRQVDLSQRELFATQRPILVPTASLASMGSEGAYLELDAATIAVTAGVRNVGPGTALNVRLVLFGRAPTSAPSVRPSRRSAWSLPPLPAGEQTSIALEVGGSLMDGAERINDEALLTLFAAPMPSRSEVNFSAIYVALGRLTMTCSDIYGRKHAAIWDIDQQQHWHVVGYREDIPADLNDLQERTLKAMQPPFR